MTGVMEAAAKPTRYHSLQTGHDSPPALTCSPSTRMAAPLPRPKPSSPVARPEPPRGCPPDTAVSSAMTFGEAQKLPTLTSPMPGSTSPKKVGWGWWGWWVGRMGEQGGNFPGRASL